MNFSELVKYLLNIFLQPQSDWETGKLNNHVSKNNFKKLIIYLALSLFIFRLFGKTLKYLPFYSFINIFTYSLLSSVSDLIFITLVIYVVNKLYVHFTNKVNISCVILLVFLTLLPFYASTIIFNIFPPLFFLLLLGFYGFYLGYIGINKIFNLTGDKQIIFFLLYIFVTIGIYILLRFLIINPFFDFIF